MCLPGNALHTSALPFSRLLLYVIKNICDSEYKYLKTRSLLLSNALLPRTLLFLVSFNIHAPIALYIRIRENIYFFLIRRPIRSLYIFIAALAGSYFEIQYTHGYSISPSVEFQIRPNGIIKPTPYIYTYTPARAFGTLKF